VAVTLAQGGSFNDPNYMGPPAGAAMPQQNNGFANPLLKMMMFRNFFDMNMGPAMMMSNMLGGGNSGGGMGSMLFPLMMLGGGF